MSSRRGEKGTKTGAIPVYFHLFRAEVATRFLASLSGPESVRPRPTPQAC
jgi:hypothetical protein